MITAKAEPKTKVTAATTTAMSEAVLANQLFTTIEQLVELTPEAYRAEVQCYFIQCMNVQFGREDRVVDYTAQVKLQRAHSHLVDIISFIQK